MPKKAKRTKPEVAKTVVDLGRDDSALIFKSNGDMQIILPRGEEDEEANDGSVMAGVLAVLAAQQDPEFMDLVQRTVRTIEKTPKEEIRPELAPASRSITVLVQDGFIYPTSLPQGTDLIVVDKDSGETLKYRMDRGDVVQVDRHITGDLTPSFL